MFLEQTSSGSKKRKRYVATNPRGVFLMMDAVALHVSSGLGAWTSREFYDEC